MKSRIDIGVGALILTAAVLPYIVEVVAQLWIQAGFVEALPAKIRAALPPHPQRPWLVFLGSFRFQLAFWRYVRADVPGDTAEIVALKYRMRASLHREAVWAACAVVTALVLIVKGWRPFS